jgi:hypothetical protein
MKNTTIRKHAYLLWERQESFSDTVNGYDYIASVVSVRNVIWSTGRIKLTWKNLGTLRTSPAALCPPQTVAYASLFQRHI